MYTGVYIILLIIYSCFICYYYVSAIYLLFSIYIYIYLSFAQESLAYYLCDFLSKQFTVASNELTCRTPI